LRHSVTTCCCRVGPNVPITKRSGLLVTRTRRARRTACARCRDRYSARFVVLRRQIHNVLTGSLDQAVRWKWRSDNPARSAPSRGRNCLDGVVLIHELKIELGPRPIIRPITCGGRERTRSEALDIGADHSSPDRRSRSAWTPPNARQSPLPGFDSRRPLQCDVAGHRGHSNP
jgi:hypothetical protein